MSVHQRSVRPSGSGGPGHVQEGRYSSFGSQRRPISQVAISREKERLGESLSSQPKGPEQQYSVSAPQDGRIAPIKGNVVTGGQNLQNMSEGCILCNPPVSEIQEVCDSRKIPAERPSIRALLPLLRTFSRSSGFYKVIKSPYLSLLRKLNVRIIIYLDGMLLMASSLEDLLITIITLTFTLQHLGFLINIKKFYLEPTSALEFLRLIVDSGEITLSLPKEKLLKVQIPCQKILEKGKVTVRELSKRIGRLPSTAIGVLPAPLQDRQLQHQQVQKLFCHNSFDEKVAISVEVRKELLCWKENLALYNARYLIFPPPQTIISSDASLQDWGVSCHCLTRGGYGPWRNKSFT